MRSILWVHSIRVLPDEKGRAKISWCTSIFPRSSGSSAKLVEVLSKSANAMLLIFRINKLLYSLTSWLCRKGMSGGEKNRKSINVRIVYFISFTQINPQKALLP